MKYNPPLTLSDEVKKMESELAGIKFSLFHAKAILLRLFLKNQSIVTDELTEREKEWIQTGNFFLDGENKLNLTLNNEKL